MGGAGGAPTSSQTLDAGGFVIWWQKVEGTSGSSYFLCETDERAKCGLIREMKIFRQVGHHKFAEAVGYMPPIHFLSSS